MTSRPGPVLVWLDELPADASHAVGVAGSKMGRLVELRRCGMNVPDGFAVTTDAYRQFCVANALDEVIASRMAGLSQAVANDGFDGRAPATAAVDAAAVVAVDSAAADIRAAVESAAMPEGIAEAIAEAYEELSYRCLDLNTPVAVRSSATGEDAADASFAGQFDTYLGMSGPARVVAAVQRCWASLFTARAVGYRLAHNRSHIDSPMAVGVVELVNARASGVAFSIHPVTGKRDRLVIEGSWGWGEAVVQGLVTPDHIEVGKSDRRVLGHVVAHKAVVSAFDYQRGQVVEIDMPKRLQDEPVLDAEQIAAVVEAVLAIEAHYGYPVDVEWVLDRHRRPGEPIHIVQTRPETVHSTESPGSPGSRNGASGPGSVTAAGAADAPAAPAWDPVAYANKYAFSRRR